MNTAPSLSRGRIVAYAALAIALTLAALAGVAGLLVVSWPTIGLGPSPDALATVTVPSMAGTLTAIDVRTASGAAVPFRITRSRLWPGVALDPGQRVIVTASVTRPGWIAWLVGRHATSTTAIVTPTARLTSAWVKAPSGKPAAAVFDAPVAVIAVSGGKSQTLRTPSTSVVIAAGTSGERSAGAIDIAAAARTWERLPRPVRVTWFASRPYPQVMVDPSVTSTLAPDSRITLTLSEPVSSVFKGATPKVVGASGVWATVDDHTLAFRPKGFGFPMGSTAHLQFPAAVHVVGQSGDSMARQVSWSVPNGSTVRLEQLLAQLGYLPLDWDPTGADIATHSVPAQVRAAVDPPAGQFTWRYPKTTPPELRKLWHVGGMNIVTYAAIMLYEDQHGMPADGHAGPKVWRTIIADSMAGKRRKDGYSYVFVHRETPQLLSLWHEGKVIFTSPGNTGIPEAPTQLGTYPVFEHIPVGTMSGTNPSGTTYNDPGIKWISYFHNGEALHSFNRSSFGTPQSLGCVELPLASAAKVWPYTPVGTLVTIEN